MNRRRVLTAPLSAVTGSLLGQKGPEPASGSRIRLALNAYSFNQPLSAGNMALADVVEYCSVHGIDALDATGYYFPGYPKVPTDEYLYDLKRAAFLRGVSITGTGVRNDFAVPDAAARRRGVQIVKDWIDVAQKLGASVIRVFSGQKAPDGYSFDQALSWMAADLKECAAQGERHGVIVGLQNHDDFLKTAAETIRVVDAVGSDWFRIILDVGSLRQREPYAEIEQLVPYAVSWQLKESVWYGGREAPADLGRIKRIIDKAGYRGVVSIETLGAGDPRVKVARFLERVRTAFSI